MLEKGKRRILAIVNRDIRKTRGFSLELDGSVTVDWVEKDGTSEKLPGKELRVDLEPGDAAIFSWPAP